jgi:hypothetical protein
MTTRTRRLCQTMSEVGAKSAYGITTKEGWQAELSSSGRVPVVGRRLNPGTADRSDIFPAGTLLLAARTSVPGTGTCPSPLILRPRYSRGPSPALPRPRLTPSSLHLLTPRGTCTSACTPPAPLSRPPARFQSDTTLRHRDRSSAATVRGPGRAPPLFSFGGPGPFFELSPTSLRPAVAVGGLSPTHARPRCFELLPRPCRACPAPGG